MTSTKTVAAAAFGAFTLPAIAQPTITIDLDTPDPSGQVFAGDTITVTVGIDGVDFDPFAAFNTVDPLPAPNGYQIDVAFSGGGTVNAGSFVEFQPRPFEDLFGVPGLDVDSLFTGNVLSDGLVAQGSNLSAIGTNPVSLSTNGLYEEGALFSFTFTADSDFNGAVTISILPPSGPAGQVFSEDVLQYGLTIDSEPNPGVTELLLVSDEPQENTSFNTGEGVSGVAAGFGNASLGSVTFNVVPSPGAAALLGVAGVAVIRRRR
ncbi:MAG: hypothetical protein AAGI17_06360 [Planctomycetota bacterium]